MKKHLLQGTADPRERSPFQVLFWEVHQTPDLAVVRILMLSTSRDTAEKLQLLVLPVNKFFP